MAPTQQSVTVTTAASGPLALGLPDTRSSARMSIALTNLGTTPLLNPQIYPEGVPMPYSFADIQRALPMGASDEELCKACWRYISDRFYHFCSAGTQDGTDRELAISLFSGINGYGFGCCDQKAMYLAMLWSQLGFSSRLDLMAFHTVCEVFYDRGWHMFDPDHKIFYPLRDGKTVASMEEVLADPELIVLASAHTGNLDPEGSDAKSMARLYVANAPTLHYVAPVPAQTLPFQVYPSETFTLFSANQTAGDVCVQSSPLYRVLCTGVGSGLFQWNISAAQPGLFPYFAKMQNIQITKGTGAPAFAQSPSGPASLVFHRASPFPLLAAQVWVRQGGAGGALTARYSTDGSTWSQPVPFIPNPHRAGFTASADLGPVLRSASDYYVQLDLSGAFQIQELALESHVQVNPALFPLFAQGAATPLHYKDDGDPRQARSVLATVAAVPLDTQFQNLKLDRNPLPGGAGATYVAAPELLVANGSGRSPAGTAFDFVFTLDQPRTVRQLRADVLAGGAASPAVAWQVQTRLAPNQPWGAYLSGTQQLPGQLVIDSYVQALQIRLLGTASTPVQFQHLAAYGQPEAAAQPNPAALPNSCVSNLRGPTTPAVQDLLDGHPSGTLVTNGTSILDLTLGFKAPIQLQQVVPSWGSLASGVTNTNILGLGPWQPTWLRLGTAAGPGPAAPGAIPLVDAEVNAFRIQATGSGRLGVYGIQSFGPTVAP